MAISSRRVSFKEDLLSARFNEVSVGLIRNRQHEWLKEEMNLKSLLRGFGKRVREFREA
jgi:hypothetical protein